MPNTPQEVDVIGSVIAPSAGALHRLNLRETAFPETQHVLRNVQILGDFTDGAERVRRLVQFLAPYPSSSCSSTTLSGLMRCLRIAEGLNTMTRRGEIGTSLPVLGLRPTRCPFLRTTKDPNEDSFTVSPRSRQSVISWSTSSTRAADSVRDRPT